MSRDAHVLEQPSIRSEAALGWLGVISTVAVVSMMASAIATVAVENADSRIRGGADAPYAGGALPQQVAYESTISASLVPGSKAEAPVARIVAPLRPALPMSDSLLALAPSVPSILSAPFPERRLEREERCLTEAVYFEARGEPRLGKLAVAEVIMNRARSPRFPDTACAVIAQGQDKRHKCQFSYKCDGQPERIENARAWAEARSVADDVLYAGLHPVTAGATHYHADRVVPGWSNRLLKTRRIGQHIFYREK